MKTWTSLWPLVIIASVLIVIAYPITATVLVLVVVALILIVALLILMNRKSWVIELFEEKNRLKMELCSRLTRFSCDPWLSMRPPCWPRLLLRRLPSFWLTWTPISAVGLLREFKLTGVVERDPPPIKSSTESNQFQIFRKKSRF